MDSSEEDDNFDKYITTISETNFALYYIQPDVTPQNSLKAINNTLKTVFAPSSTPSSHKPTKRTVLKRSAGQIMTEKDVIKQMEENMQKKNSKKSKKNTRKSNVTKRPKSNANGKLK